jgi:hypothetical protein
MSFEPIKINIKDLRRFTEVVHIIDSSLFITEAKQIRKKYGITQPLGNNNPQQWTLTNIPKKKISMLFQEITDLRIFFSYDSNYQDIFEKAVLGGDIKDDDYKSTSLVNFAKLPPFLTYILTQNFGILLTPQTDKQDVLAAFNRYRNILKEFQSTPDTCNPRDKRADKKNEIERDRKWYWKKMKGMSYLEIAKEMGISKEKFYSSYKFTIRGAIRSYKRNLVESA